MTDKMREAFEKWYLMQPIAHKSHIVRISNGHYFGAHTETAWRAWQAAQSYCPSPDPVKLAELGWQMIECPICGGGAQAFPQQAAQSVPEHIRSIKIPTDTMEQEFQTHYRRGFEAGKKSVQPVAVVGDVVAITGEPIAILRREIGEDTWFDWTPVLPNSKTHQQLKAAGEMDYCEVYQRYTQSITSTELATLREKAAMVDELRKDAERLQWMIEETAILMYSVGIDRTLCRVEWPLTGYVQDAFYPSERAAIDAAIAQGKGE